MSSMCTGSSQTSGSAGHICTGKPLFLLHLQALRQISPAQESCSESPMVAEKAVAFPVLKDRISAIGPLLNFFCPRYSARLP